MRYLRYIIVFVLALAAALLAVANRHVVPFSLDPLPLMLDLPLYVALLAAAAVGFVAGSLGAWWAGRRFRRAARRERRMAAELAALRSAPPSLPTKTGTA